MKNNQFLRAILIMVVTVVVFGVAAFGLNFITGPIIAENNAGAALGALKEVMPEGESFEDITANITIDASTGIKEVYKETTGKGFVFKGEKAGYSKTVYATVGVTADGKVCGLVFDENGDFPVSEDTINSFIGKDSALADIVLTGGATTSSNTLKSIVEAGMNILISNNLITAGVKSDDQLLNELIPVVYAAITFDGLLVADDVAASGNIVSGYKAKNGAGFAYLMSKNDSLFLAITNTMNGCAIFDTQGNNVTTSHSDLVTEALNHTSENMISNVEKANSVFKTLMGTEEVTSLTTNLMSSVVAIGEFEVDGNKYYGFYAKPFGYNKNAMDVYVIIDANGAIAKVDITEIIYDKHYFEMSGMFDGTLSNGAEYSDVVYKELMNGLTSETFDGSQAIISSATKSSNAVSQAINDAFAAYEALKNGGSN